MGSILGHDVEAHIFLCIAHEPLALCACASASRCSRQILVDTFCDEARHTDASRRRLALDIVRSSAEIGDVGVLAVSVKCLHDSSTHVRLSAAKTLECVARLGDEVVIRALTERLTVATEDDVVVRALLSAATQIALPGDRAIRSTVQDLLQAENWVTRKAAVRAVRELSETGDRDAVAVLTPCLHDEDRWVRIAALDAVTKVTWRGDLEAVALAASLADDDVMCVRAAALEALPQIAHQGDRRALAAVHARLDDSYSIVRAAALEALAELSMPADRESLTLAEARLTDEDSNVRIEAVEALVSIAETGCEGALAAIGLLMKEDEDEEVREVAASALERL